LSLRRTGLLRSGGDGSEPLAAGKVVGPLDKPVRLEARVAVRQIHKSGRRIPESKLMVSKRGPRGAISDAGNCGSPRPGGRTRVAFVPLSLRRQNRRAKRRGSGPGGGGAARQLFGDRSSVEVCQLRVSHHWWRQHVSAQIPLLRKEVM